MFIWSGESCSFFLATLYVYVKEIIFGNSIIYPRGELSEPEYMA